MKDKKIMTIVGIVLLLLIVIGASYAYFIAQIGSEASTNVTIEADTVDSLQFTTSGELSIKLNQDNFASGGGNKKTSTTARATLIAGTNRNPSYTYNVYLAINLNEFKYTTSDKKPELILRITAPTGALTSFEGLTYNSTLSGFDITEESGVITLASNYEITTTSTLRQNWKVEVEAINLDSDQSDNAGRRIDAELIIRQNSIPTVLADVCASGDNLAGCIKEYADNSSYYYSRILHHDENLENGANDGSYRYTGGNYRVTGPYTNSNNVKYTFVRGPIKTSIIRLFGMFEGDDTPYEITNLYEWDEENLAYYDSHYYTVSYDDKQHYSTYEEALERAISDKYIVALNSVNNYVCFGSDEVNCPKNNLYRIIGVFGNQIKLMKAYIPTDSILGKDGTCNSYGTCYWGDSTSKNNWAISPLNTTNLNINYINSLNNIDTKWTNMIIESSWNVGGIKSTDLDTNFKNVYENELGTCDTCTGKNAKTNAKIGLVYISDYLYSYDSTYWKDRGGRDTYRISDANWMSDTEKDLLTISKYENDSYNYNIWTINEGRYVNDRQTYSSGLVALPTFYLNENIKYTSGDGSVANPFRITV